MRQQVASFLEGSLTSYFKGLQGELQDEYHALRLIHAAIKSLFTKLPIKKKK